MPLGASRRLGRDYVQPLATPMKACVCGGSNENCRYCFGSGYVAKATGLPVGNRASRSWAPGSLPEPPKEENKHFSHGPPLSAHSELWDLLLWGLLVPLLAYLVLWVLLSK